MLPQKDKVFHCLELLWFLLFPQHLRPRDFFLRPEANEPLETAARKIRAEFRNAFIEQVQRTLKQKTSAETLVDDFLKKIPAIQNKLLRDAQFACDRDPAVESLDEVIFCYPGFLALTTYRLAHELAQLKVPLIPRMMSEAAHTLTGCDIHPEAQIGTPLFIDHGTGVVIGQTSIIGNRVTLFQGVTLGAIALHEKNSPAKRHPTIEDDVILYSNATILGGDTVIGKGSVVGGSCWITFSVPPHSKIILANPRSLLSHSQKVIEDVPHWDI